jgi:ribosome modulation factor
MKIHYKTNCEGLVSTTVCPYRDDDTKIGSIACVLMCPYNDETNEAEQWVECHRAAHEVEKQ